MLQKRELELIESIEKRLFDLADAARAGIPDPNPWIVMDVAQVRSLLSIIERLEQQLIGVRGELACREGWEGDNEQQTSP